MEDINFRSLIIDYANRNNLSNFYEGGNIPSKKNRYKIASVNETEIVLYYDVTFWGSGDRGLIFTDKELYWRDTRDKVGVIIYTDMKNISGESRQNHHWLKINSTGIRLDHGDDNLRRVVGLLSSIRNAIEQKKQEELREKELKEEHKKKLHLSKTYETALRYEDAAKIYEELNMWEDAGRVRKLALQAKFPTTQVSGKNVHIGDKRWAHSTYVDDHSIKDSVVQRSIIDEKSQKKLAICPYCGEKLNFPETPRFCPYCEKKILI